MKIAVCDDDAFARDKIISCIKNREPKCDEYELSEFFCGEDMVNTVQNGYAPDVIFLDIEMNKTDGIDAAKLIRIHKNNAIIVFVSSHSERVFDVFDCEPLNFITKPFSQEKFNDVFSKVLHKYKLINDRLIVTWRNETLKISISSIKYLESYRRHVIFHTFDGEYETVSSLDDVTKKLTLYGFVKCHQGYSVNMNLIKRFDGSDIILSDGTKVMMSQRKKSTVLKKYAEYIVGCR